MTLQPTHAPLLIQVTLAVVVLLAAVYDLRYRRIPNWLNLSAIILGFAFNTFFNHWQGASSAGLGLLLAAGVYLPLYLLRGMGAGDVKLMAAVGALLGPVGWFWVFIATALAGGAAAILFAFFKRRFAETCCNLYFLLSDLAHLRMPYRSNPQLDFRNPAALGMPHGILIALGSLLFLALPLLGYVAPHLLNGRGSDFSGALFGYRQEKYASLLHVLSEFSTLRQSVLAEAAAESS